MRLYDSDGIGREFYDLCRRYKYEYKTYLQKKEVDDKYSNKWTSDVLKEQVDKLSEITNEMLEYLLGDVVIHSRRVDVFNNHEIVMSNPVFAKILMEAMRKNLEYM